MTHKPPHFLASDSYHTINIVISSYFLTTVMGRDHNEVTQAPFSLHQTCKCTFTCRHSALACNFLNTKDSSCELDAILMHTDSQQRFFLHKGHFYHDPLCLPVDVLSALREALALNNFTAIKCKILRPFQSSSFGVMFETLLRSFIPRSQSAWWVM